MGPIDNTLAPQLMAQERADSVATAKDAGEAFEGYMIEMMVREMRKTIPEGIFSNNAMEMFSGMLDQELAKRIGESGGLGLGSLIAHDVIHGVAPPISGVAPEPATPPQRHGGSLSSRHGGLLSGAKLPVAGRISSRFGHRSDPIHGGKRLHRGLDIAAPRGTAIRPVRSGEVVFAGERGGFGNAVIIDHGGGWRTTYAHCDRLDVKPGQQVGPDTIIGAVGSTGRSTGPHLHLEVHRDGEAVDPAEVLGL